jgi:hypothetical protein
LMRARPLPDRDEVAESGSGSFSTETGCPRHVRFTPVSDRTADIPDRQLWADSVEKGLQ